MRIFAIYISFAEHWECGVVFCCGKFFDLCVSTWLLAQELIAWEREDFEASFAVFIV